MKITEEMYRQALEQRHGKEQQKILEGSTVGVAGLGGLGSHIAVMLARMGVGNLVLADFDTVDLTNIHRQQYTLDDVGKKKTEAILGYLKKVNPYINYRIFDGKITGENAGEIYADCQIVCEAFDQPQAKAMLIETLLERMPKLYLVTGSGMAGIGSANTMETSRPFQRLYVCGDKVSEVGEEEGLFSPRVTLCAAQEALMNVRLILEITEP